MAKQWIGFDIGDCSVKMVHVTGKEIKNTVVAELPDNIVDDGQIISMDAMADLSVNMRNRAVCQKRMQQ